MQRQSNNKGDKCAKLCVGLRMEWIRPSWSFPLTTSVLTLLLFWPCGADCRYQIDDSSEEVWSGGKGNGNGSDVGLTPPVFNLARHAVITANGTCGELGDETYCKLTEHVHNRPPRPSQCQVCSAESPDKSKRHPIKYAIDESNRWWQSPTLQNGRQYEWITITIDLKKVYQVAYIIIKAANSPRPGNWILERSRDGVDFLPWQYFAVSDEECRTRYGIIAKPGKPSYSEDDEVICTSYFSKATPFEGGEIHTSLINGRPGAATMSEKLTKFTMARFIRLRLQKIRTLHGELMSVGRSGSESWDKTVMRRYFYSIKDIAIGGSCVCFGHARECVIGEDGTSPTARCMCQHNTCGDNCDVCCPLFNQYQWGAGNSTDSAACEQCQCYGHAESCVYDPMVHEKQLSINTFGTYDGGGVCLDCKAHTTGVNCEKCVEGYYRPKGIALDDPVPCVKCNCSSLGSVGYCVPSQTEATTLGKEPGDCLCKDGFAGRNCDRCAVGYKSYPHCEPCPCNLAGIVNLNCKGDCVCKENVEGTLCNTCKKGYFNLDRGNVDGCTQCFCHGVATECVSSNFPIVQINATDKWFVTDLHGTKVLPAQKIGDVHSVANEDFASFNEYYWTVESAFAGKRIHSYGLNVTFRVSWVQVRGDTSGRPIPEFNVIVQSANAMLAFGHQFYDGTNATISVALNENNCFVLPDVDNNVIERLDRRVPCTRYDVMEGLSDIKRLLLRAKYHTDQIEGMLHYALFATADPNAEILPGDNKAATSVEVCSCPPGYTGTSCEDCGYSYRKSSKDSWLNECIKCDCNGHSPSCDFEGNCNGCDHNTTGSKCETCIDGFYGDATTESVNSCKPCECPLAVSSNNFSPTCEMSGNSYVCTACPSGYTGPYCERCANGWFGNPTQEGDSCQPCNCNSELSDSDKLANANICDHLTGECLVCPKNTVGWNCDECLTGYYGDPLNGTCIPCKCNELGSLNANCDLETGQCYCKQYFEGKHCEVCIEGHGSPKEGCPLCDCNPLGSSSHNCDVVTGQCSCKPGIGGRYCNKCLDLHFGFGFSGCSPCGCDTDGSDSPLCDLNSGQCHCRPSVEGRRCDVCSNGHWNLGSGNGCEPCSCNVIGSSHNSSCDFVTGQCFCKDGVGGLLCDRCQDKHYGFSHAGCQECDPCDKLGHVCDADSGRCVCPPNTEGESCEKCRVGFWGITQNGCQECNCSQQGSSTPQCSAETGKCNCLPGYEGDKCDVCKFGYFNYPTCTPCECDAAGTKDVYCNQDGVCSCSEEGHCQCKEKVTGNKCDRCTEGTYGLDQSNVEGCMPCFCFHRTNRCSQGYFKWQRLALPTDRHIAIKPGQKDNQLRSINSLIVIPDTAETIFIEEDISFGAPLYWQLPHIFLGDKVLSYNGYLRFHIGSTSTSALFPPNVLASYPLVQIQRNSKLVIEYYPEKPALNGFFEVRLHQDFWRRKNHPEDDSVSKETMMVVLQNVQHILIRATNAPEVFNVSFFNVSLDIAMPHNEVDTSVAHGIEVCDCPPEYNSTSCQNPKLGYYRWYKREYITSTIIIDLVGQAVPCECNGRSDVCDTESGHCLNCANNTGGPHCDICAPGYYGDAFDKCHPCRCPSVSNNHADACKHLGFNNFQCYCKAGYQGKSCDRCDYGYFGNPWEPNGTCQSCRCNHYGSVSDECHEITGQCNCRKGVTGRDCSRCSGRHVIIGKMCTSCDDQCTGLLLNTVEDLSNILYGVNISQDTAAVWRALLNLDTTAKNLRGNVTDLMTLPLFLDDMPDYSNLYRIFLVRLQELEKLSLNQVRSSSSLLATNSKQILTRIDDIKANAENVIASLQDYITGRAPRINHEVAQLEAFQIVNSMKGVDFLVAQSEAQLELDLSLEVLESIEPLLSSSASRNELIKRFDSLKETYKDLLLYIDNARKTTEQAEEITSKGTQLMSKYQRNLEAVENATIDLDVDRLMTDDKISEVNYVYIEIDQVLQMIEDILSDFRNTTKEVEIRDNSLFDLVPLYRAQYAQPAFNHVEMLKNLARDYQGVVNSIERSGSEHLKAVTAYQRIYDGFRTALQVATDALKHSRDTSSKIKSLLSTAETDETLRASAILVEQGLALSGVLENDMRGNLQSLKAYMNDLKWKIKLGNETLRSIFNQMEEFDENWRLNELMDRIMEIHQTVNEVRLDVLELEKKIDDDLESKMSQIGGGSAASSVHLTHKLNRASSEIHNVAAKAMALQRKTVTSKSSPLNEKMRKLRALITQSRHQADTVDVAIGPDDDGTCFRLFKWPPIEDATSISFNFAPTRRTDSLLFYWPSSLNDDYISIEMVNLNIKASWELGSGHRTLVHPFKLSSISENSDDPDHWVRVTLERVGSWVSLDVKRVEDLNTPSTSLSYQNSDEEASLLNLAPDDLIHIGGMSKQVRQGLVTNGGLSGCLHNLMVNARDIGLWNFVGNEGCSPCVQCLQDVTEIESTELDYYFDGRGYARVNRIEARAFNPKFFELNLEFRTFLETALLFLTVNERLGQMISLELREGSLVMQVRHNWEDHGDWLRIQSENVRVNTGEWIKLRAVWVFQKGVQTGQLTIGTTNFNQVKPSASELSLEMYDAAYQIGGLSPAFSAAKVQDIVTTVPFVGCMKNFLIDSATYDLLSGLHFGIEYECGGKKTHTCSFEGDGFAEYASASMGKDFVLGFSFKTLSPTGILALSTFATSSNDSPAEPYYAIYLENGRIRAQFGVSHGPSDFTSDETRYDDGKFHAFRLVKKNRRVIIYIDDLEIGETRLPKKSPVVAAPSKRGLLIGGMSSGVRRQFSETPLKITRGFAGCIQNFYFSKKLLNFNNPISYENQNLGPCPKRFTMDSSAIPPQFLYPATVELPGIRYDRPYADHTCLSSQKVIEQEDPLKSLHFGDTSDSYALLSLDRSKSLRQHFNLTFQFRTFYPNGLFFVGVKHKSTGGNCLTCSLKDGRVVVSLMGERALDLTSSAVGLNDGGWHLVTIVKADDKLFLYVDSSKVTQTKVPRMKPVSKIYIGGYPAIGADCFSNLILKPDYFKGCLREFVLNSVPYTFNENNALLHNVSPCFKEVQPGTFFKSGGYAIYSHNLTLGNLVEVALDFRSDARDGILLSFIPKGSSEYPTFTIFLQNGQVVAKETFNAVESIEAREVFTESGYVCNGEWHSVKANYEKGAITLKVDSHSPKFAVDETVMRSENHGHGFYVSGSLYIGGLEDGASPPTKKSQFHGCIRNIAINRQRKDWTDMAYLSNIVLNACPL